MCVHSFHSHYLDFTCTISVNYKLFVVLRFLPNSKHLSWMFPLDHHLYPWTIETHHNITVNPGMDHGGYYAHIQITWIVSYTIILHTPTQFWFYIKYKYRDFRIFSPIWVHFAIFRILYNIYIIVQIFWIMYCVLLILAVQYIFLSLLSVLLPHDSTITQETRDADTALNQCWSNVYDPTLAD